MIETGSPAPLGATVDEAGTNFAVYSSVAERMELCLFDGSGRQTEIHHLHRSDDGVWHGYLPGCSAGQHYGYRADGPYEPNRGLRCNAAKLLIDPYARAVTATFQWHPAVFDYRWPRRDEAPQINSDDSAPYVPKSIVCADTLDADYRRPQVPWSESIFYEANTRGFTMRHPAIDEADRGRFNGMRHKAVLGHLRALGVTALELMPVQAFIDEQHLSDKGLRNFWGYNPIAYFAPNPRYAGVDAALEFRDMVRAFHDAGIEVILDVVYNHTAEGDGRGPTLSFRGLDNLAYYSTEPGQPGRYINDTGCGNTFNADHPQVRKLVLDSLRYWHRDMGVDGFRFDLAPVLGRHNHGFSPTHPLLTAIESDELLQAAKLIAEPWDPGPGGYQLGQFGKRWAEWNDRFRDDVRRFWRGDHGASGNFAKRMHGSAEIFESTGRSPHASVNLITSHDGFTLADLVSYEHRHNLANGENNKDGHAHNYSCNHGIEGPSDDAAIVGIRRRQRLNMMASLLLSQGTPMLLAGDEFGHSQDGNNNAYAQDNEVGWLDWSGLDSDPDFFADVAALVRLRRDTPSLRWPQYVHGRRDAAGTVHEIEWLHPDGQHMGDHDWPGARSFCVVMSDTDPDGRQQAAAVLVNASERPSSFVLPKIDELRWRLVFASADDARYRTPCAPAQADDSGIAGQAMTEFHRAHRVRRIY